MQIVVSRLGIEVPYSVYEHLGLDDKVGIALNPVDQALVKLINPILIPDRSLAHYFDIFPIQYEPEIVYGIHFYPNQLPLKDRIPLGRYNRSSSRYNANHVLTFILKEHETKLDREKQSAEKEKQC